MPSELGTGLKPEKPKVEFELVRGDLGPGTSCDDTGIITLKIEGSSNRKVGYRIEVMESSMAHPVFPDYGFYSTNFEDGKNVFCFPWADGATEVQEPVKIVFKLFALSPTWAESEPLLITIEDQGRFWH